MDENSCIIYTGENFTLEWYYDKNGNSVGYDYFLDLTKGQRRKLLALVKRMGDFGKIYDNTKFRNEGDGIFAFKPQPDRFLSFFTDDKKIIVTNGFLKKTDKLPKTEKELAVKLRQDYFDRKSGGNK
jgi:phage-related protein